MINFIKRDFISVRYALEQLVKRKIPVGIVLIYYVVVGTIAILLFPFIMIYMKIKLGIGIRRTIEILKREFRREA